jgi:hypothetical protein
MSDAIADYRLRSVYKHPHSQAERAEAAARKAPPGPVAVVNARHADEIGALHRRHGDENTRLRENHTRTRESWQERHNGVQMAHADLKKMKIEVDGLRQKHEDEAASLRSKHKRELEKVVTDNPLP